MHFTCRQNTWMIFCQLFQAQWWAPTLTATSTCCHYYRTVPVCGYGGNIYVLQLSCVCFASTVDMWSVGCIFAEMLSNRPIFPGKHCILILLLLCVSHFTSSFPGYQGISEGNNIFVFWNLSVFIRQFVYSKFTVLIIFILLVKCLLLPSCVAMTKSHYIITQDFKA